ncbi:unnamed protein product [Cunninghamella echinulata]
MPSSSLNDWLQNKYNLINQENNNNNNNNNNYDNLDMTAQPTKRRKINEKNEIYSISEIILPAFCSTLTSSLCELINKETLFMTWDYYIHDSLEMASIKVYTGNTKQLVLENEAVRPHIDTDDFMTAMMDEKTRFTSDFYFNLVKLCSSHITLANQIILKKKNDIPIATTSNFKDNDYNCAIHFMLSAKINQPSIRKKLIECLFPFLYPLPNQHQHKNDSFSINLFYQYLQPTISKNILSKCRSEHLIPILTPFQSQNVEWMVKQEGYNISNDGSFNKILISTDQLPYLWEKVEVTENKYMYINRITQQMISILTPELIDQKQRLYHGGILADEMGLGKTVCTIALILLHNVYKTNEFEKINIDRLKKTGATLIITPASIIHQWENEIHQHAPNIKVVIYSGIKTIPNDINIVEYADSLASNDIVLTTYNVLCSEIYHSRDVPKRPRRHDIKYKSKRSPLVQYIWWRCILDEAQMVESTHSLVTEMASLIPRYYSWGLSGTPLKSVNFENLYGLYRFVDYIGEMTLPQFKHFYSTRDFQPLFLDFSKSIMRRNLKSLLQDQINIPKQHQHIIKLSFSTIEQHYYNDLWSMCCNDAMPHWLDSINWEAPDDSLETYNLYKNQMQSLRRWLTILRENCIYPAIKGTNQEEEVRTLDQVLQKMINQVAEKIEESQVSLANTYLTIGGMHELLQEWDKSLSFYLGNTSLVLKMVDEYKIKVEQAKIDQKPNNHQKNDYTKINNNNNNNKEIRLVTLLQKYTMWQNILHRFYFYTAGIYHMLKDNSKEDEYYDKAAETRRQILIRFQEKVELSIKEVNHHLPVSIQIITYNAQKETIFLDSEFLERLNNLTDALNDQLSLIGEWRALLKKYITSSLVDSKSNDVQGDEYEQSFEIQKKCDIYQDVYQDILRDRNYYLTGFWIAQRVTNNQYEEDEDLEQEHDENAIKQLYEQLQSLRKELAPIQGSDNLQNMISKLKEKLSQPHVNEMESKILQMELARLNSEFKKQKEIQDALESEYRRFSNLSNHRIEYYRALQHISDNVKTWESESPQEELAELHIQKTSLEDTINQQLSKKRYLENIAKEKSDNSSNDEDENLFCLICKENFTRGVVTYCGHMYCNECAFAWFRSSMKCPQCNSSVKKNEWYPISRRSTTLQQLSSDENQSNDSMKTELNEIKNVVIKEGLGAKLDSIIKHIKYIQMKNNGKCIVFSQWNRVLGLLSSGLKKNNIEFVDIASGRKDDDIIRFKQDPSINVILLHARSQSSGLNLIEAKTVFIVEPLLNESLEKQALGRVHRIGQNEETSVFWYIVRDTIEEKIQDIHNKKQRHHQINDLNLEGTTNITMASLSEGGGEYVSDEDLRQCFTNLPIEN